MRSSTINRRVAIICSGGDAPGMNNAVCYATNILEKQGHTPLLFQDGYDGLLDGDPIEKPKPDMCKFELESGSVIGCKRCPAFKTKEGREKAIINLNKHKITDLIVIGGDGSLRGALFLFKEYKKHYKKSGKILGTVVIPATIDNDIPGTNWSLGTDSALRIGTECTKMIKWTAGAQGRIFFVELMGRDSGFLTIMTALSCGCDYVLIPEHIFSGSSDGDKRLTALIEMLKIKINEKGDQSIIIPIAEGWELIGFTTEQLIDFLGKQGIDQSRLRMQRLGYVQRGATPTAYDLSLASRYAAKAVEIIDKGYRSPWMVGIKENEVYMVPLSKVAKDCKTLKMSAGSRTRVQNLPDDIHKLATKLWDKG